MQSLVIDLLAATRGARISLVRACCLQQYTLRSTSWQVALRSLLAFFSALIAANVAALDFNDLTATLLALPAQSAGVFWKHNLRNLSRAVAACCTVAPDPEQVLLLYRNHMFPCRLSVFRHAHFATRSVPRWSPSSSRSSLPPHKTTCCRCLLLERSAGTLT